MINWLLALDKKLLLSLNHSHTPFLDWLMWQFSGNLLWLPLYFFIIYLIIKKYKQQTWWIIMLIIIAVGVADFTSVHLFKETVRRLRPCHDPALMDRIILVHNHCGGLYGFFSSHASNTFTLATASALLIHRRYFTVIMFLWAIVISISRVYLGVHYPSDIMAGALWGIIIGLLFYKGINTLIHKQDGQSKG